MYVFVTMTTYTEPTVGSVYVDSGLNICGIMFTNTYIYIHIHIYIHRQCSPHLRVYMYVCKCITLTCYTVIHTMILCVFICMCVCVCLYVCVSLYVCMCMSVCVCMCGKQTNTIMIFYGQKKTYNTCTKRSSEDCIRVFNISHTHTDCVKHPQ